MKINRLLTVLMAATGLAGYGAVASADAAAGKATFNEICSECHEVADFEGEPAADLSATIQKIVAGSAATASTPSAVKASDASACPARPHE